MAKKSKPKAAPKKRKRAKSKRVGKLTPWTLLEGSHQFPGPDGGTCINEAAIVARGFEYRQVSGIDSMPDCFSPVISTFAMILNDNMGDDDRNKFLFPFVTRIAGTTDKLKAEVRRLDFILFERVKNTDEINDFDLLKIAAECCNYTNKKPEAAIKLYRTLAGKRTDQWVRQLLDTLIKVDVGDYDLPSEIAEAATHWEGFGHHKNFKKESSKTRKELAAAAESLANMYGPDWKFAVKVLDKAIKMGKHASVSDIKTINKRLRDYKEADRVDRVVGRASDNDSDDDE